MFQGALAKLNSDAQQRLPRYRSAVARSLRERLRAWRRQLLQGECSACSELWRHWPSPERSRRTPRYPKPGLVASNGARHSGHMPPAEGGSRRCRPCQPLQAQYGRAHPARSTRPAKPGPRSAHLVRAASEPAFRLRRDPTPFVLLCRRSCGHRSAQEARSAQARPPLERSRRLQCARRRKARPRLRWPASSSRCSRTWSSTSRRTTSEPSATMRR